MDDPEIGKMHLYYLSVEDKDDQALIGLCTTPDGTFPGFWLFAGAINANSLSDNHFFGFAIRRINISHSMTFPRRVSDRACSAEAHWRQSTSVSGCFCLIYVPLSVSAFLPLFVSVCLFLPACLPAYLSVYIIYLSISVCLCLSLSVSVCLCLCLSGSVWVCLSLSGSVCVYLGLLGLSVSAGAGCVCPCLPIFACLLVPACLLVLACVCLSVCICLRACAHLLACS